MDWLSPIKEIFGSATPFPEPLSIIRAIAGFIFVFFLPGFTWTLVFFRGKQINVLERIALSFGLSIAVVTISILFLNMLLGIKITVLSSALIIIVVTIIPIALYYLNRLIKRR